MPMMLKRSNALSQNLIAKATITIDAGKKAVWDALTQPKQIEKYMFGADVGY